MKHLSYCLALTIGVGASSAAAQVTTRIESDGSEIVATVWTQAGASSTTVLLIPGWGGGPADALGIASALSDAGASVLTLTPRGWHESEGASTFANALDDIGAALAWIRDSDRARAFGLGTGEVILGGYSWGGGMSLAYAARDPSVARVFSVAGTDHGQFIRQYKSDAQFARMVDEILASSAAPSGPIRFNVEQGLREMDQGQAVYGLLENAPGLSDRDILLLGGWEDQNVTVDGTLLPLYRALRAEGGERVRFETYHTDHSFAGVRNELHHDLLDWIGLR